MRMHYQVLLLSLAAVLLWQQQCLAEPENARMLIACSPYVYPCECGLCPRIVNCKSTMSAECFCGTAAAGSYPHPKVRQHTTRFRGHRCSLFFRWSQRTYMSVDHAILASSAT